jgi:hypothetical protein
MTSRFRIAVGATLAGLFVAGTLAAQTPAWVENLEKAYPSRDWVRDTASGAQSQSAAELAAQNALAKSFKTDIKGLSQANNRMSELQSDAAGKSSVSIDRSVYSDIAASTNVQGLIGVETETWQAKDGAWYGVARMNRQKCAARYSGLVKENAAVIGQLLALAERSSGFDAYSALAYAASFAEITDNYQNILEVLDPAAVKRKPGYGGAGAIKAKARETAANIVVGIALDCSEKSDAQLMSRALASFFTDRGFKTSEKSAGNYALDASLRFEARAGDRIKESRYFFDAAIADESGTALFSYTEENYKRHLDAAVAKRQALAAAEASVKKGKFAEDFEAWLGSLVE